MKPEICKLHTSTQERIPLRERPKQQRKAKHGARRMKAVEDIYSDLNKEKLRLL
jgi:hypothetical protein